MSFLSHNRSRFRTFAVLAGAFALAAAGAGWMQWTPHGAQRDVLATAYSVPDGGGYCRLTDTGVPQPVVFKGVKILGASKGGSYCCGFTFLVAMKVAEQRGLLRDKEPYEIREFQQEWYGAVPGTGEKELVLAMTNLGIGREVPSAEARPGDFVTFQWINGGAHSAVFLGWVYDGKTIAGFRYRSSQHSSRGVADRTAYFTTSGNYAGLVKPNHFHVGRLKS